MANAAGGGKGARGAKKPSLQGQAGLALQNRLPNARVVYVSATGATTPENLSTTQGEVEVEYDGIRIEQFGDTITMGKDGLFQGLPDDFWVEVARRHHQQGS